MSPNRTSLGVDDNAIGIPQGGVSNDLSVGPIVVGLFYFGVIAPVCPVDDPENVEKHYNILIFVMAR